MIMIMIMILMVWVGLGWVAACSLVLGYL
jgi:hypothetical protein